MGVRAITAKTCRTICTNEIIDLTADKLPAEFAMVIDNSSYDEDGNMNGYENENSGDKTKIEDQDNIKIKDKEEIMIKIEKQDEEQDAMEDEYEEENNSAIYEDKEDEGN